MVYMVTRRVARGVKRLVPRLLATRHSSVSRTWQPSVFQFLTTCRSRGLTSLSHDRISFLTCERRRWRQETAIGQKRQTGTATASEVSKPSAIEELSGRDLVLSPPALVVTREYEWANILVGFEQANKYTIRAAPGGQVVGYLAEVSIIFLYQPVRPMPL